MLEPQRLGTYVSVVHFDHVDLPATAGAFGSFSTHRSTRDFEVKRTTRMRRDIFVMRRRQPVVFIHRLASQSPRASRISSDTNCRHRASDTTGRVAPRLSDAAVRSALVGAVGISCLSNLRGKSGHPDRTAP